MNRDTCTASRDRCIIFLVKSPVRDICIPAVVPGAGAGANGDGEVFKRAARWCSKVCSLTISEIFIGGGGGGGSAFPKSVTKPVWPANPQEFVGA